MMAEDASAKILVIEDYPPVLKSITRGLTESGYAVTPVTHGAEGLDRALAGGFDLIVLDLMLPRVDGLTILRAIAKHHQPGTGFLTEGVDWNNHVGEQHHFGGLKYGDIRYTEPLLNNQHIVEPTLIGIELGIIKD